MKKRKFNDGGIFREGMPVPQDIDGASVTPRPVMKKPPMPIKKPPMAVKKPMMPVAPKPRSAPPDESVMPAPAFKKGGSIDGIARQGKTKGRMC